MKYACANHRTNDDIDMQKLLAQVIDIAIAAGREILEVYSGDFAVETKSDGSPLTAADRRAHELICARLQQVAPSIALLSEESEASVFAQRRRWRRFWLIDPLDGTKGFVRRNDEFTVNIALVEDRRAVLGVVYAPVGGACYYAAEGLGAFKSTAPRAASAAAPARIGAPIQARKLNPQRVVMVASRAHPSPAVRAYHQRLAAKTASVEITPMGSSLKICRVAEGRADIYPRLGPTSEWDTAAAHCVLTAAGGALTAADGAALLYNKENILNPWFLAAGDSAFDWVALAQGLNPAH